MHESSRTLAAKRRGGWRALAVMVAALAAFAALVGVALAAPIDFVEPVPSPEPVGNNPRGIAAADFDGDGDKDLATANISGGNTTILENNGNANFLEPGSSPEPAGSFSGAIASVDLDGDADPDLVVANQVSNDLTILKNRGNGNFVQPASSPEPAGSTPVSVAVGDVDGDLDQDLAVANAIGPAGTVTILKNNGRGNFGEPASSPEAAGNKPLSVAFADLDGDTDEDLAVANQQSFNVTILKNNGLGNFGEPASSPEPAGTFPQGIVAADLDGDGDRDLATANQGDDSTVDDLTVLLNDGSAGFVQPPSSPERAGSRPLALVAVHVNGDGLIDLAVTNSDDDNATIFRNFGAGDFRKVTSSPEAVGDRPGAIAGTDLDGDSDADLAVVNGNSSNVTILRNK